MAAPLILARTFKDAHAYAREELGLSTGYYRVVNSAGTIKAVRNVDIHLVPGWTKRPDRFTMQSALKWCRLNIIDVEKVRESAAAFDAIRATATPNRPEDGRWLDTDYTRTIADRFNSLLDSNGDNMISEGSPVAPEPEPHNLVAQITDGAHETRESLTEAVIEEIAADLEPVEPPKKRRRTKCKQCEQMHYKGDPCIESEDV